MSGSALVSTQQISVNNSEQLSGPLYTRVALNGIVQSRDCSSVNREKS